MGCYNEFIPCQSEMTGLASSNTKGSEAKLKMFVTLDSAGGWNTQAVSDTLFFLRPWRGPWPSSDDVLGSLSSSEPSLAVACL